MFLGSLLNLHAVTMAARRAGDDVAVFCAGFKGGFALDDAYCAGRFAQQLGGEPTDAAIAAALVAGRSHGLEAERPHVRPARARGRRRVLREPTRSMFRASRMVGTAAEIVARTSQQRGDLDCSRPRPADRVAAVEVIADRRIGAEREHLHGFRWPDCAADEV